MWEEVLTKRDINRALPFWQQVLRLEDWRIVVRIAKVAELEHEDVGATEGLNYIHPEEMESEILLRRGATEETLVHELLHLVVDGDAPLRAYDVLHERGINRIAGALMRLRDMNEDG